MNVIANINTQNQQQIQDQDADKNIGSRSRFWCLWIIFISNRGVCLLACCQRANSNQITSLHYDTDENDNDDEDYGGCDDEEMYYSEVNNKETV